MIKILKDKYNNKLYLTVLRSWGEHIYVGVTDMHPFDFEGVSNNDIIIAGAMSVHDTDIINDEVLKVYIAFAYPAMSKEIYLFKKGSELNVDRLYYVLICQHLFDYYHEIKNNTPVGYSQQMIDFQSYAKPLLFHMENNKIKKSISKYLGIKF